MKNSNNIDERDKCSRILCTSCMAQNGIFLPSNNIIACDNCGKEFTIYNGVVDLRHDKKFDTMLDQNSYDIEHKITKNSSVNVYKIYLDLLTNYMENVEGCVLELGSGSGNLSLPFVSMSPFSNFFLSDISPVFLEIIRKKLSSTNNRDIKYYLFDANRIPFKDSTFNAIIGHSVLHHFAFFEQTLSDCYRTLKDRGVAVFGEPILDTHVFSSLASRLILEVDSNRLNSIFSEKEKQILTIIGQRSSLKQKRIHSKRSSLKEVEDKFIFSIDYMRDKASEIGFNHFCCPSRLQTSLKAEIIKRMVLVFNQMNIEIIEKLNEYDYIFQSLEETYGDTMRNYLRPGFGFFIFVK